MYLRGAPAPSSTTVGPYSWHPAVGPLSNRCALHQTLPAIQFLVTLDCQTMQALHVEPLLAITQTKILWNSLKPQQPNIFNSYCLTDGLNDTWQSYAWETRENPRHKFSGSIRNLSSTSVEPRNHSTSKNLCGST